MWPIWLIVLVVMTGCANMQSDISNEHLLESGTISPPKYRKINHTYCYRSLSSVDCYAQPLKNEHARLVGAYDAETQRTFDPPSPYNIKDAVNMNKNSKKHPGIISDIVAGKFRSKKLKNKK